MTSKILFKRRSERRGRGHPDLHGGGGHGGYLHQGRGAARGHGRQDRPLRGRRHRRRCQDLQQHASGGECHSAKHVTLLKFLFNRVKYNIFSPFKIHILPFYSKCSTVLYFINDENHDLKIPHLRHFHPNCAINLLCIEVQVSKYIFTRGVPPD